MTFILRTWVYFYVLALPLLSNKSVSIQITPLTLIVSSQSLVLLLAILTPSLSFAPVVVTTVSSLLLLSSPGTDAVKIVSSTPVAIAALSEARNDKSTFSNITLLDLYPELKDYLWKKAISQMISTTIPKNGAIPPTEGSYYLPSLSSYGSDYNTGQQQLQEQYNSLQNGWGWGGDYANNGYYGTGPNSAPGGQSNNVVGNSLSVMPPPNSGGIMGVGGAGNNRDGIGTWNSRESNLDSDTQESSYNYQKEVLKHWYPFGSPEFYDSWKFKPSPPLSKHHEHHPPSPVSSGWGSVFPFWEDAEESHQVTHELSKDFSCLAGLLGLKTLKTLKFAIIFKKLKMLAIFFIAFKLGVLLSPIAIPLLFPIIILVTVVKILPLILIIVLLLKILKKQVKIKKPFGKYLESTGSLFFDDVEYVTEKVLSSDDEYIDKLASGIKKRKSSERRSKSKSIKGVTEAEEQISTPRANKRINSRMLS